MPLCSCCDIFVDIVATVVIVAGAAAAAAVVVVDTLLCLLSGRYLAGTKLKILSLESIGLRTLDLKM